MTEKRDLATKLHNMESGILGVHNSPTIQAKMMAFGYTPSKIEIGLSLLNKAKQATASQVGGYGDQYAASNEVGQSWAETYGKYMVTVKVNRIAFKGRPDLLVKFRVTGRRNRSFSGWLNDARIMYANILDTPEALDVLTNYGYSIEKLTAERDAVEAVEALHNKRLAEKSEAQQGTVERDKAIDELCDWYSDFRAIARIALYDAPQQLEALGISAKN
jgi:acyl-CoA synthetase (NDP forming)